MTRRQLTPGQKRHLETLFRGLRHTLLNRGLYRQLKDGRIQEVAWKRTILLDDLGIVAFEIDPLRLPIKIERLLDPHVAHQMQTSLSGRRVWPVNTTGLAFCVRLEPDPPHPTTRLPRRIPLDLTTRPGEGQYHIPIGLGKSGPAWRSLHHTGHILVGGETGSGKSTWLNTMLIALLTGHTPQQLQVAIIDPKQIEFQTYRGLPHLFADPAAEIHHATALTARLTLEMDRRMAAFTHQSVKTLPAYNRRAADPLPLLLILIDEVTDIALQAGLKSDLYKDITRLTSKGRAFGLVLVLATQNPKAEVLNTLIRGNMSTRLAFRVATAAHSRVILGESGAQTLPRTVRGRLIARLDRDLETFQGFYLADDRLDALTARLRTHPPQLLSDLERAMIRYTIEQLDGQFNTNMLWPAFRRHIGRDALLALARRWERIGWLIDQPGANAARRITKELQQLAGIDT